MKVFDTIGKNIAKQIQTYIAKSQIYNLDTVQCVSKCCQSWTIFATKVSDLFIKKNQKKFACFYKK